MPAPRRHARLLKFAPALVLIALALPSSAFGATSRSWVSGTGDDANPCSRTKPCKTFQGALTKTATGGVIRCLDPGGYGTVTISKSITIKCSDHEGKISSGSAILVDAGVTGKVTLRGLDINGTGVETARVGVHVATAASVHIIDSEISRYKAGVWVDPGGAFTRASTRVVVANSHIHDNGIGIFNAPGVFIPDGGFAILTARNNLIADNGCGVATSAYGASSSVPDPSKGECGSVEPPGVTSETAISSIFGNGIYDNGEGVFVRGPDAFALIAYNRIAGNYLFGMHTLEAATLQTFTPATNVVVNNAATDPPNSAVAQTKRQARKRNRGR